MNNLYWNYCPVRSINVQTLQVIIPSLLDYPPDHDSNPIAEDTTSVSHGT